MIIDPTLMMGQMSFCVPSTIDSSKQVCVSNVSLMGSGNLEPGLVYYLPPPPPAPIFAYAYAELVRDATITGGAVSSELLGGGDQMVTPNDENAILLDQVFGEVIQ